MNIQLTPLILSVLFFSMRCFSQQNDTIPKNDYIEVMHHKLSIKFDVDDNIETFDVQQDELDFKIKPNIDYRADISVHYRFISFKLGFSPHLFSGYDKANKGKTKRFNMGTDIYIKKWIQSFSYSQTKGYYSPDFQVPDEYPTDYLVLDKLKYYNFRGITRYRFNKNYSLKAILTQTEIQRKSAGTFLPSLSYSYNRLINGYTNQNLYTWSFVLGAGYLHTFVISEKFYASLGASPGVGVDLNKIVVETTNGKITSNDTNYTLNLDGHVGLGYNSSSWFAGTFFRALSTTRKETEIVNFDTFRTHFQVFVGYRFGAPKFLEEQVDWIIEKAPFKLEK